MVKPLPPGLKAPALPAGGLAYRLRLLADRPTWRFTALLVLQAGLVFIVVPALGEREVPLWLTRALTLLMTAGTILLVSASAVVRLAIAVIFVGVFVSRMWANTLPELAGGLVSAIYFGALTVLIGRGVFARGPVDAHRIAGAVSVYLSAALTFAAAYGAIIAISPEAFGGLAPGRAVRAEDLMHFSLTTITTVGYGDIVARTPMARSLADLEAVFGQLFPATLLARMVGLSVGSR